MNIGHGTLFAALALMILPLSRAAADADHNAQAALADYIAANADRAARREAVLRLDDEAIDAIVAFTYPDASSRVLSEKIAPLTARLGDPAFKVRRQAVEDLIQIGSPCRPVVTTLVQTPDPEVQCLAREILQAIADVDRRLAADRTRTVKEFYYLLLAHWPVERLRVSTRRNLAVLSAITEFQDEWEEKILAVLLASLRYSHDAKDHQALAAFVRDSHDAAAAVAVRVMEAGLIPLVDKDAPPHWRDLPPRDYTDFFLETIRSGRSELVYALLPSLSGEQALAALRRTRSHLDPTRQGDILYPIQVFLWRTVGDEESRQFLLAELASGRRVAESAIQLYLHDRLGMRRELEKASWARDPAADRLRRALLSGEKESRDRPAEVYVCCMPLPSLVTWHPRLTLRPRDMPEDTDETTNRFTRPLAAPFAIEHFESLPSGRYRFALDDGNTTLEEDVFLMPGVQIVVLPAPQAGMDPDTARPNPFAAGKMPQVVIDLGRGAPRFLAQAQLTDESKRSRLTLYRVLSGPISLRNIPQGKYRIHADAFADGTGITAHGDDFLLSVPEECANVRLPLWRIQGQWKNFPTNNLSASIGFYTQAAVAPRGDMALPLTVAVPVRSDGTFTAFLFDGEWLARSDGEQKVVITEQTRTVIFDPKRSDTYYVRVHVVDHATGQPVEGQIFAVVPIEHCPGIGGFVRQVGLHDGLASLENLEPRPGHYLYARAPGYMNSPPLFFHPDGNKDLELKLKPGGLELVGRVTNKKTGQPVPKVDTLGLYYKDANRHVLLDYYPYDTSKKEFRVTGLRPGLYTVKIWGYRPVGGETFEIKDQAGPTNVQVFVEPE